MTNQCSSKPCFTPYLVSAADYRACNTTKTLLVAIATIAIIGAYVAYFKGFYPMISLGTLGGVGGLTLSLAGLLHVYYRPKPPPPPPAPPPPAPPPAPQTVEELVTKGGLGMQTAVAQTISASIYEHFDLESTHISNRWWPNFKMELEMNLRSYLFPSGDFTLSRLSWNSDDEGEDGPKNFDLATERATIKGPDATLEVTTTVNGHNELRFECEIFEGTTMVHQFQVYHTIADAPTWSGFGPGW